MIGYERFLQILGGRGFFHALPAYQDFDEALKNTTGYENRDIIQVVSRKTEVLRKGLSETCGQTAPIADRQMIQNMFVMSHVWSGEPLNILDIGGACGATYFVLDHLLPGKIGSWNVLETPMMAAEGMRFFQDGKLRFTDKIEEVIKKNCNFNLLFSSGVFQYLPHPTTALDRWLKMRIPFVYFTRTMVGIDSGRPVVTKQVTDLMSHGPGPPPDGVSNYKTSQPITIIPYEMILSSFSKAYTTEFIFKEDEDKSVRVGSQLIKIRTIGFLATMNEGER
jgi:putative methyltransferase (TIGR04325 family)